MLVRNLFKSTTSSTLLGKRFCFSKLSLKDLRSVAQKENIDLSDCFDKSDIVEKIKHCSLDFRDAKQEKKKADFKQETKKNRASS